MAIASQQGWLDAEKAPFEAFGILYYPLFESRADLGCPELDDADMAWAVTANANLEGTGYLLSQISILTLAACHHAMASLARSDSFLPLAEALEDSGINPLEDIRRLVPDVTAAPMYPDFPRQVMGMSEAQYRYDQMCHYASTYGVRLIAGMMGLNVSVGKGWLPESDATPKARLDQTMVEPKVLHVLVTMEDLRNVVAARLARATRMHPAEIETALLVYGKADEDASLEEFPRVAFHENMMALILAASTRGSATLARVAGGLSQHPGDLLKAIRYVLHARKAKHLTTAQKRGFCRAFERYDVHSIARSIVDAGRAERLSPNYLSVARFGGPKLRAAVDLVETSRVRSWASELESLWLDLQRQDQEASAAERTRYGSFFRDLSSHKPAGAELDWTPLLAKYGERPGILLRSLTRLAKGGCPLDLLRGAVLGHARDYSLPTLVSVLTNLASPSRNRTCGSRMSILLNGGDAADDAERTRLYEKLRPLLLDLLDARLRELDTPLRGRRVSLDTAGISLAGSILMPNVQGETGTAWPPIGMAWDLPADKKIRFFTFWDDPSHDIDVDLHFYGRMLSGGTVHIGWNGSYSERGLVTSGDMTTSENSVEFLDANIEEALAGGIVYVVQRQHIYYGSRNWGDIETCYSGALVVDDTSPDVELVNLENLLFRDDLTGSGRNMAYACIDLRDHYVRIIRGANIPVDKAHFSLGDYLDRLFTAQQATLVDDPDEADVRVCVGRSDDPAVVSLFDEGFFLR